MLRKIAGRSGELRAGYQCAAKLGRWKMESLVLEADVIESNPFWLSQGPLQARLDVGRTRWVWQVKELLENGRGRLRARLGQKGE